MVMTSIGKMEIPPVAVQSVSASHRRDHRPMAGSLHKKKAFQNRFQGLGLDLKS
jgi:hypothetical protein